MADMSERRKNVPQPLIEDFEVFREVVSLDTWKNVLTEEERQHLQAFLPKMSDDASENERYQTECIQKLFSEESFQFETPLKRVWLSLRSTEGKTEVQEKRDRLTEQKERLYYLKMFEVLFNRHYSLLGDGLGLETVSSKKRKSLRESLELKAAKQFSHVMTSFCQKNGFSDSSDDEVHFVSRSQKLLKGAHQRLSDGWYHQLLKKHSRRKKKFANGGHPITMATEGISLDDVIRRDKGTDLDVDEDAPLIFVPKPVNTPLPRSRKTPATKSKEPASTIDSDDVALNRNAPLFPEQKIHDVKKFIGIKVDKSIHLKEEPYEGLYSSFFALIKAIFLSMKGHKAELGKIEKKVGQWQRSAEFAQCQWVKRQPSWIPLVQSALCYMAAEVGAISCKEQLPGFMALVEFRDRVDNWKWIGYGRDSDVELFASFSHWMETLDKSEVIIDYSDYLPPIIGGEKDIALAPLTEEELDLLHELEHQRYARPNKSFRYTVHGYEAAVGPLKGVPKQGVTLSKAREHFLLRSERPSVVTILSLVRDAASRLPNGEGTRAEICGLVRDSQYVREVTDSQINAAVSGALDRLHYEKDPCVRYDSSRKLWIYLHRARTEEDFENIHVAVEEANRYRKKLMSKPVKMRIFLPSGEEVESDAANDDDSPPTLPSPVLIQSQEKLKTREQKKTKKTAPKADSSRVQPQSSIRKPPSFTKREYALAFSVSSDEEDILTGKPFPKKQAPPTTNSSSSSGSDSEGEDVDEEIPIITSSVPSAGPFMLMDSIVDKGNLEALENIFNSDSTSSSNSD